MARWNTIARGAAVAAVATLALAACTVEGEGSESSGSADGGSSSGDALKIGSLLPITGSLAFLGPPEIAGVDLAIEEINEAGGVLGQDVEVIHKDSSDTANPQIASQSVSELIAQGVGGIVGAASSSVSLNVVDDITAASVVQISPANTSTALSGYPGGFYFRVAPPDTVQGDALANVIMEDGIEKLGILVFEDDYGTSLRDVIVDTVGDDVDVTYGATETFDPTATNFSAEAQAVMATDPDAILIIAFEQTIQVIKALQTAGWDDFSQTYYTDGNTADYSEDLDAGLLEGAKGTIPGANPTEDFQALLNGVADEPLDSYSYGAESYDSTMLLALAALRGEGTDGATIQANMAAVSGAEGGTECTGFAECAALLEDGEEIAYQSVSGSGAFNDANDPASAFIGVYEFDGDNVPVWIDAVEGAVPAA